MLRTLIVALLVAAPCVSADVFSTVYNDTYARWLVQVNGAAFATNPDPCIANIGDPNDKWSVVKVAEVPCSPLRFLHNTCAFIIIKSDVKKQYIIAFRGTTDRDQLIAQFLTSTPEPYRGYGTVNTYFLNAFKKLWPAIRSGLSQAKAEGYSIVVTGYSLGGAIATITGAKVVASGLQTRENTYLLTFGSPRVGNSKFSSLVDTLLPYRHRVVNKADPVPHIPPCISVGNICTPFLGVGYYQSQGEVWYPNGSTEPDYVVTTQNEDPNGSNQLGPKHNVSDHISYFGLNLQNFGNANCVA